MQRPDPAPVVRALQTILETGSCWQQGGLDPVTGCGCFGLVHYTFCLIGIPLPATAEEAQGLFVQVPPPYRPFDVVLSSLGPLLGARHLGLLLSATKGYHVSQASNGLAQFALTQAFWRRVVRHGLRYKGFLAAEGERQALP